MLRTLAWSSLLDRDSGRRRQAWSNPQGGAFSTMARTAARKAGSSSFRMSARLCRGLLGLLDPNIVRPSSIPQRCCGRGQKSCGAGWSGFRNCGMKRRAAGTASKASDSDLRIRAGRLGSEGNGRCAEGFGDTLAMEFEPVLWCQLSRRGCDCPPQNKSPPVC
jgi:hypothetical protein